MTEGSRATAFQPGYFLTRHALYVAAGIAAGVAAFQVPLRVWQQAANREHAARALLQLVIEESAAEPGQS